MEYPIPHEPGFSTTRPNFRMGFSHTRNTHILLNNLQERTQENCSWESQHNGLSTRRELSYHAD